MQLLWQLIAGDVLTYLLITLIGFSSHGALAPAALPRMLATFIPFTASWFIVAPWFGIFNESHMSGRTYLLRVLVAAVLTAPMGAFLRGLWLSTPILPTFVLVMGAVSMALMTAWRFIHRLIMGRHS